MRERRAQLDKPLIWIGSSYRDFKEFPDAVTSDVGFALRAVQGGRTPGSARPLKGFHGASVLEIVDRHDTDTYRVVYTVRFPKVVYVLHAFMKKSKQGIKTPQSEIELIASRLGCAEVDYAERYQGDGG